MAIFTVLDLLEWEAQPQNDLNLRCLAGRKGLHREITVVEVNRPGLALSGFFRDFAASRIQVIGRGESAFLEELDTAGEYENIRRLMESGSPCYVVCDGLTPPARFLDMAEESQTAILGTTLDSSSFTLRLLRVLGDVFAPQKTIHGVFVEVLGMGVLIEGESGVGKSESALELVQRGHRLIADDAVRVKCLNGTWLWGYGTSKILGHHMEIRGLGIINLAQLFGINAIRDRKMIDIVVRLEEWDPGKNYDRIGVGEETTDILGVHLPHVTIPVKPGRNIPVLIEAAVLNQRLKEQGQHAAREFNKNLIQWLESENARNIYLERFGRDSR